MLILNRSNSSIYSNPDCSVGKEPACNAGDPGLIPGLGRSTGEGIGYPLQYSWAFLMAQLIQNPPAMWETWVWSLGWEDPWRRERLPTPVFWSGEFMGSQRLRHDWVPFTSFHMHKRVRVDVFEPTFSRALMHVCACPCTCVSHS